jgi:hypothetical protein
MLNRIENGDADGILAWHPDRLARNAVDGGRLIHLLDTGKLHDLKFPTFWFENTPQGKFVLSIAFGQSKYYIDNLSENVRRGNRQAIRRGEWPSRSPVGYFRNRELRKQLIDPVSAPIVRRLFELYATGKHTFLDLKKEAHALGLRNLNRKPFSKGGIFRLMHNPFYYGFMDYKGELFSGGHEPLISKSLFDAAQEVLHQRNRPKKYKKRHFAFTGLARCSSCNCSITATLKKGHNYYHCTKRRGKCPELFVREEALDEQITRAVAKIALSPEELRELLLRWSQNKIETHQTPDEIREQLKNRIAELDSMLSRLLDGYLAGVIEQDVMRDRKVGLLSKRASAQEQLKRYEQDRTAWLKPYEDCLDLTQRARELVENSDLDRKKELLLKIGTGFKLSQRVLSFEYSEPWSLLGLTTISS